MLSVNKVNHEYSKEFGVQVIVHQGSTLSLLIFIIVRQDIMEEFKTGRPRELIYADDLVSKQILHQSWKRNSSYGNEA